MPNRLRRGRIIIVSLFLPFFALAIFLLLFMVFLPSQAANSIYTVNSTADTNDGSCNANNCTLREAILAANDNPGGDTINFSLPPNATIVLNGSELPAIIDRLTINGRSATNLTISGNNGCRVFLIGPLPPGYLSPGEGNGDRMSGGGPTVTITGLVIVDGIEGYGGAIFNDGQLTVKDTKIIDTVSSYGAIFNNRALTVENSVLINNTAVNGAAIYSKNFGSVTIQNSDFISNTGTSSTGGAIFILDGKILVENSTFTGNKVFNQEEGGAIRGLNTRMTISNSTFNGNSAYSGGAIYASYFLTVTNSTFSGNTADWEGGAIYSRGAMTISNSTVNGNTAGFRGGGIYSYWNLNYSNTIIANSLDGGDCYSLNSISMNIRNLVEDGSCNPTFTGDPLLSPLEDNGGSTLTHMPAPNSPIIDKGNNTVCESFDQRGWPRPVDGDDNSSAVCDIGAVEVGDWLNLMPVMLKP
jgi:CSLREA domain-containing protein